MTGRIRGGILGLWTLGLSALCLSILCEASPPSPADDPTYFLIQSMTINEVMTAGPAALPSPDTWDGFEKNSTADEGLSSWLDPIDTVNVAVEKIINIGKQIWTVVEAGKPVSNVQSDVATALPQGITAWTDMQGWQAPQAKSWSVSFTNGYNAEVVKLVYRVIYVAGGSVNGVGQYIAYATIQPVEVNVAWGFTLNAQGSAPTVYNMGTKAAPLAGMNLLMKWSVDTVLKHTEQSQAFFLNGKGALQVIP